MESSESRWKAASSRRSPPHSRGPGVRDRLRAMPRSIKEMSSSSHQLSTVKNRLVSIAAKLEFVDINPPASRLETLARLERGRYRGRGAQNPEGRTYALLMRLDVREPPEGVALYFRVSCGSSRSPSWPWPPFVLVAALVTLHRVRAAPPGFYPCSARRCSPVVCAWISRATGPQALHLVRLRRNHMARNPQGSGMLREGKSASRKRKSSWRRGAAGRRPANRRGTGRGNTAHPGRAGPGHGWRPRQRQVP